jgi:NADP-dependent 3-hydroxy acid dehydrogenase YdfG
METSSGIKDKVVAVTGASSGIGEATALLLAERGAKLVLGARRLDRLKALAERIVAAGGEAADFAESMTNPEIKVQIVDSMEKMAIPPDAIARAIAFAIEQPADVDVGEIVIRPTAQS